MQSLRTAHCLLVDHILEKEPSPKLDREEGWQPPDFTVNQLLQALLQVLALRHFFNLLKVI